MISNISFGSTYKVSSMQNDDAKRAKFYDYAHSKPLEDGMIFSSEVKQSSAYPVRFKSVFTLIAPDKFDSELETYCANNGIIYSKLSSEDLLSPQAIYKRLQPTRVHTKTRILDVDKFEKLLKDQKENISYCESMYHQYFKNGIDIALKKGDKIPMTTLSVFPAYGSSVEDSIDYIKRYGADNLNKGQFFIDFLQASDDPDHCTYFALKELGMKEIPVCVNTITDKLGSALGIFK